MDEIDKFLDTVDIPAHMMKSDYYFRLHIDFYPAVLEKLKSQSNYDGRVVRYKEFLLVFDADMKQDFMFVKSIEEEINRLFELQQNNRRWFSQKEHDTLKYLVHNSFIYKISPVLEESQAALSASQPKPNKILFKAPDCEEIDLVDECTPYDAEKFEKVKKDHVLEFYNGKLVNDYFKDKEFKHKRFIVFGWDNNEGCGGMNDYQFCSDDINEAFTWIRKSKSSDNLNIAEKFENYQIFDRIEGKEIKI